MSLLITLGLGDEGYGQKSALLTTVGLGDAGPPDDSVFHPLQLLFIEPSATQLMVIFSNTINPGPTTTIPSKWVVTETTGVKVTVSHVTVDDYRVFLTVNEQTIGAVYNLKVPTGSDLIDKYGNEIGGTDNMDFIGAGVKPAFGMARAIDARLLEVIFSEAVTEETATNPANYTITPINPFVSPAVTIQSIRMTAPYKVELTTTKMEPEDGYDVEVQNIRDLANNLLTHT